MNNILKAVLQVGEAVAIQAVPGAKLVDAAVHGIVDHSKSPEDGILDAAEGAIQVIEGIKGTDIADEVKFRAGIATLEAGFKLVKDSLKSSGN